jgi:hypothetical protein
LRFLSVCIAGLDYDGVVLSWWQNLCSTISRAFILCFFRGFSSFKMWGQRKYFDSKFSFY